jgi:hypothetical protein
MVTLKKSIYSKIYNCWISTDYENVYKIEKSKFSTLLENTTVYDICEIKNSIYLIYENGYTVYPQEYTVRFHGVVQDMYVNETCIIANSSEFTIIDLYNGEVTNCERHKDSMFIINKNINNNYTYDFIIDNKLYINTQKVFEIPAHILGDPIYSFEFSNDKYIILKVSNFFSKKWYTLFDKRNSQFTTWIFMREINNFLYFPKINKTLVEYDEFLLILSNEDLYDMFKGKSFNEIIKKIDKGCNSMIYSIDKKSKYSINCDETYLFYIKNKKIMATMTCFPYDMHILCRLDKQVNYITSHNYEVLLQYTDLSIDIISI